MGAAVAVPAVISAVGTGLNIYGNVKANRAQSDAEFQNFQYYREQGKYIEGTTKRQLEQFDYESTQFIGSQKAAIASSGFDIAGSPMALVTDTLEILSRERKDIEAEGAFRMREAMLKGDISLGRSKDLRSFSANFLPAAGSILTSASGFMARSK
jgi:hypothetical protein